jgi:hypothetical protein
MDELDFANNGYKTAEINTNGNYAFERSLADGKAVLQR